MDKLSSDEPLPPIPEKRYFTIGEVGELCAVKSHVLRYWEQEFPQLKPVKRRGNRRYYQRHDVEIVRKIRSLLYAEGFTISGARQRLTAERDDAEADDSLEEITVSLDINELVAELEDVVRLLRK